MGLGYRAYGLVIGIVLAAVGAVVTGYTLLEPNSLGILATMVGLAGVGIGLIIAVAAWKVD